MESEETKDAEEQPQAPKGREVVIQESELNLMIQQLNIAGAALQTLAILVNGMAGRLKERK